MMARWMVAGLLALLPCQEKKQFTFVTYNVLADAVRTKERIPVLLRILKEADADVIALQEVVPWFTALLAKEEWAKRYQTTTIRPEEAGGQYILSRHPIQKASNHRLAGPQGRTVLVATIKVGDRLIDVATTHMESPLESGKVRARQLDEIFPLLKSEEAVFLGDLNFGDGEPEEKRVDAAFVDLWKALKPADPGHTWNIETSDMAKKGSFPGEKSRRIDRILVRSKVWKPREVRIIGDQPVVEGKKDLFPSDHFGLVGILARE